MSTPSGCIQGMGNGAPLDAFIEHLSAPLRGKSVPVVGAPMPRCPLRAGSLVWLDPKGQEPSEFTCTKHSLRYPESDISTVAPIASLTKLMTAMAVLDAQQASNEDLRTDTADAGCLKHSHGGMPVGAVASRGSLLELALLASDDRAASALARSYPGGMPRFEMVMQRKIHALGLDSTSIAEPTGLSPNNMSSGQERALTPARGANPRRPLRSGSPITLQRLGPTGDRASCRSRR